MIKCSLGIIREIMTHSEESQKKLNTFTVQPRKKKNQQFTVYLQHWLMGMWGFMRGRKWTAVSEMFHRISCQWYTLTHANTQLLYTCEGAFKNIQTTVPGSMVD